MKKEKEENRGLGKKHIIIFLVGVLLISGAVSYAYFTGITRTTGVGEVTTSTTVVNANTTLTTEGTLEFNDSDIYPGHKNISTIKVTATGKDEVDYNVIWTGTNSFTTTLNYYVYKTTTEESPSITCNKTTGLVDNMTTYYEVCTESGFDNLGSVVASGEIPTLSESTKIELIKGENIQATEEGNSVYYHVVIEYPNKEEGQNADFNKSINGEVVVEVAGPTASEVILLNKNIVEMPSITGVAIEDTTGTVYSVADDDGTSYVFRGNPSDNWISFGGYYWRIIRVNGDGSVRIIYNGTSTDQTGEGTQIGEYAFNSNYNDNAYIGFMYGSAGVSSYAATHANTNNSPIKTELDSWYTSSGLSNYVDFIDINAGFCNDRQVGTSMSGYGTLGYGTNQTVYAPFNRFLTQNQMWNTTQQTPSLKCSQADNDLFTMKDSNKGNKDLTNPLGLITIDEVAFAGGFGGATNDSYYLCNQQNYWTMSPYYFSGGRAYVFYVGSDGFLSHSDVNGTWSLSGVRPVINLRSDVTLTGDGTIDNIYKVS